MNNSPTARSTQAISFRIFRVVRGVGRQVHWGIRNAADFSSLVRYSIDVVMFHVLAVSPLAFAGRERTINLRRGVQLHYRLNRGDIQGIREVWVDEVYRPPAAARTDSVIDLGANIGLTSLYLATRHGAQSIVAVEPDADNCRIARRNFAQNKVPAIVVQAAVGPSAGTAHFQSARDSNVGKLAADGDEVTLVTMPMILEHLPGGKVDLVKLDIEGGEGPLLTTENEWLGRMTSLLAEFHPPLVDCNELVHILTSAGFRYFAHGTEGGAAVEFFTRAQGQGSGDAHDVPSEHTGPAKDVPVADGR